MTMTLQILNGVSTLHILLIRFSLRSSHFALSGCNDCIQTEKTYYLTKLKLVSQNTQLEWSS